jgi:hypothetical protein
MSWHYLQESAEGSLVRNSSGTLPSAPSRYLSTIDQSSFKDNWMGCYQDFRSGMTSALSTELHGVAWSTSSPAGSRAKISRKQTSRQKESLVTGPGCGSNLPESFEKSSRDKSSSKTAQCSQPEGSTSCYETLPKWGIVRPGQRYQALTPALTKNGSACGSLQKKLWPATTVYSLSRPIETHQRDQKARWLLRLGSLHRGYLPLSWAEQLMRLPSGWVLPQPLATHKIRSWLQSHLST